MKSKGKLNFSYLIGLVIPPYIGFLIGNAAGCLLNDILPKSISSALGIVLFAMFIGIIVLALVVAFFVGFFVARKVFTKYLEKNPPVNEKMIRAMFQSMGRTPSEKQVRQVMASMNQAK